MNQRELIDKIEGVQNMLVAHATGGQASDTEYKKIRAELIENSAIKDEIPSFLRSCRNLSQFWGFIKQKFGSYQERRNFIWEGFSPVLAKLESQQIYPSDEIATKKIQELNQAYIHDEWQKALERRASDPEGAITSARSLLETVCKFILDSRQVQYKDSDDLPKLYKQASETLNLSPTQHTENIFKEILTGCISVVKGLGSLRNKLSDAHGKGIKYVKPSQRHAEFAVNIAGATSIFLLETWEATNNAS